MHIRSWLLYCLHQFIPSSATVEAIMKMLREGVKLLSIFTKLINSFLILAKIPCSENTYGIKVMLYKLTNIVRVKFY